MQEYKKKPLPAAAWRRLCRASALVLVAFAAVARSAGDAGLAETFTSDTIVIEGAENACYRFDVWMATTSAQHRRGLMHVRELPRFSGMLFVYSDSAFRSMWMKNTYVPLDILFIRADGTIASIAANTEPLSLTSIPSAEPIRYVLELNAGITEELEISAGSQIHLPPPAR